MTHLPTPHSARANKIIIALRLLLMPAQRLMELIHDRLLESRMAGDLRVFFQPDIATPDEMAVITRKLEAAVERLRKVDPINASAFAGTFRKIYVISQAYPSTTSSGAPKLPKAPLVSSSIPIIAAFLVQFVPMARAGLIRATYHLVDPVPVMIDMCEIQIAFLRVADPDTHATKEYIRVLEAQIAALRPS
jgi:hypothetical protein